ncbi:hypothetical protein BDF19DRAFT_173158 [Syncephalis fuscata]|nr:hypothetical protein BDF19DRAFT_173158 [Syncephalis fuscata]
MSDDSNSDSFDNVTPEELFLRKAEPARDIIFTIILFGFGCLHLWRYNQTNTKYHGMMIGSIFVAMVGFGMRIGGAYNFDFMVYYYSSFILAFSEWMIKVIVAYLMIVW